MFTDMKGFSRKMQENEVAAFEILQRHDTILRDIVLRNGGRVIKSVGDAFMVDFSSAVNAVKCAMEAQETLWAYNKEKSDFERIEIRIGIHLGDVIDVGNDMYGDGVNIASRIESITEPNRICVSQDIYNQIRNKIPVRAARIGQVELKNIAEPVEVYELLIDSIPELSTPSKKALEADAMRKAELSSRQEAEEARRIEEARRKKDEEIASKTQRHYERAQRLFDEGKVDEAEQELEEIFRLTPLHGGAQSLQLKIDAYRFQQEEERKLRQAQETRKATEEREKLIMEVIMASEDLLSQKRFEDALSLLQDVLSLDPNHPAAREMEARIRQTAAEAEASVPAENTIEATEETIEQPMVVRRPLLGLKEKPTRAFPWGTILAVTLIVVIGIAGYVLYPKLKSTFFPASASLVVLGTASEEATHPPYASAIATLMAEHFTSVRNLTVIAPSSAARFSSRQQTAGQIWKEFPVQYALLVGASPSGGTQQVEARLLDLSTQELLWRRTLTLDPTTLSADLSGVCAEVLELSETSLPVAGAPDPIVPRQPAALDLFVRAMSLLNQWEPAALTEAAALFDSVRIVEPSFLHASSYAALASLTLFELDDRAERSRLNQALQYAQTVLSRQADAPLANIVTGAVLRYNQKFDDADRYLTAALDRQPGNALARREKAHVALARGKFSQALDHARAALISDPKNPTSHLTIGLVHHFMRNFAGALEAYDAAIAAGGHATMITNRYRMSAWIAQGLIAKAVQHATALIQGDPSDFRSYYWTGRALQLGGKAFESQPYLEQGIRLATKRIEETPSDWNAFSYVGLLYGRAGKFAEAERAIAKALELNPRAAQVLYRKAALLAIQNQREEMLTWLKKAVEMEFLPAEILSPDFLLYGTDPAFSAAIAVGK